MKNKPLIFTVLSVLCMVEPLIKILYFKMTTGFDLLLIMSNLMARNTFKEVMDFWLIFPVAGLLILKLRRMTYFAFMGVLLYIVHSIVTYEKYTWPYNSDGPFFYNKIVAAVAVMVFAIFLLPRVREPFFDRRVRWWEPKTRYTVNLNCKLDNGHLCFPSSILNISQTGAFISHSAYIQVGDTLQIEFNFLGQVISLPMEVMNEHSVLGVKGFGVKFRMNYRQSLLMSKVMKVLARSRSEFKESVTAPL